MIDILDSNMIQTVIILLTGLVALLVYKLAEKAKIRDAACIILNEIRVAEMVIQQIVNSKVISELTMIMPDNSWGKYKYMFAHVLDQDGYNLINNFYNKCTMAENNRRMYYQIKNEALNEKAKYLQRVLVDLIRENLDDDQSYEQKKDKLVRKANAEAWLFDPNLPISNVVGQIERIQLITSTVYGAKLRKIAKL